MSNYFFCLETFRFSLYCINFQQAWSQWRSRPAYKLCQVEMRGQVGRITQNFQTTNRSTNSRVTGEAFPRRVRSYATGNRLLLLGEWVRVSNDRRAM